MNPPVRLNQLDCGCELVTRNLFESLSHLRRLKRGVINLVATDLLPAFDPQRAKATVAIENDQRLFGRPGYVRYLIHALSLGTEWISVQPEKLGWWGEAADERVRECARPTGTPIDARARNAYAETAL